MSEPGAGRKSRAAVGALNGIASKESIAAITGRETHPVIRTAIPGPLTQAIVAGDEQHLINTTKHAPLAAVAGKGVVVADPDGNVLLDFASGIGVLNTGHCHPRIVAAMQHQLGQLMHFAGTDFYYSQQVDLARRLGEKVPIEGPTKVFFAQSGTEANEAAIKLAKAATRRPMLLAFLGAFHGRTQGSLSLTASKSVQRAGFFPTMPGVVHTPFPNPYRNLWGIDGYDEPQELSNRALDHIETLLDTILPASDLAALFWEPVQGEGGYVVPPKMFPGMLRKLCDQHGVMLVADEVQTGFGRTGKWFASEHFGVTADIVTVAKAMGSGFPIGAAVARAELDFERQGRHSNTYGGNVLGCVAALTTIDVLADEDLVGNAARMGAQLGKRMDELRSRHAGIGDHRGLGLMRAFEFVDDKGAPAPKLRDSVEQHCWRRGLITLGCGKSSLRIIPALNVTAGQVDGAMQVMGEALVAAKA